MNIWPQGSQLCLSKTATQEQGKDVYSATVFQCRVEILAPEIRQTNKQKYIHVCVCLCVCIYIFLYTYVYT